MSFFEQPLKASPSSPPPNGNDELKALFALLILDVVLAVVVINLIIFLPKYGEW